jgi:hypothetical protein
LRRAWDRRAWAQARPDKVVPRDGAELARRWVEELHELGFREPRHAVAWTATRIGQLDRDAIAEAVLTRLGARRSAWNAADVRGEVERQIAAAGIVCEAAVRAELAEDLTGRVVSACVPLLDRHDVPEHVRALASPHVLAVENELTTRLTSRLTRHGAGPRYPAPRQQLPRHLDDLDDDQRTVVATLAGDSELIVIEGAAGAGKTTTFAAASATLDAQHRRMVVVTPTRKAAQVASGQVGTDSYPAARLLYRWGYRWDNDGHWTRAEAIPTPEDLLGPGDLLVVDEAGMVDQDTARALLELADELEVRLALVGDRHQLPAVGRGGLLDLAARWAPDSCLTLESVHRFTDPDYADLTLRMRRGEACVGVFDQLLSRGEIVIHASDVERLHALAAAGSRAAARTDGEGRMVIADAREQVAHLNGLIHDIRVATGEVSGPRFVTRAGERIGVGDQVATRRNDRDLDVANRDTWTVTHQHEDGSLVVTGRNGERTLPGSYVQTFVELAYATTVYGAQGETVDTAHLLLGDHTGAVSAYVGMTRGRHRNVAHLVADSTDDARRQWIEAFSRDRADLGPAHAAQIAADDIERYGPTASRRRPAMSPPQTIDQEAADRMRRAQELVPHYPTSHPSSSPRGPGIGI